jgi:ParB family chromosome partitioning protein
VALVVLGEEIDDTPAVSVDTQLADGDRPVAAFVAVAGEREIALDPYSIVELRRTPEDGPDSRDISALSDARAAADGLERLLHEQAARCAQLEAELAVQAGRLSSFATEVDALRAAADASAVSAVEVEDLARRVAEAQDLAVRVDQAETRAATLERELAASDEARAAEVFRLESALRERAQAVRSAEAEVARREEIVRELLSSLGDGLESSVAAEPVATPPLARVEAVGNPEGDVAIGHDEQRQRQALLDDGARQALLDENGRLKRQLDALAIDLARREADAHASGWTVAELERRLIDLQSRWAEREQKPLEGSQEADAVKAPSVDVAADDRDSGAAVSGAPLSRALDELDALRRALAQEHEARVRVESGAALAQARSDIERLTVLLEQHAARERGTSGVRATVGEPAPPHA